METVVIKAAGAAASASESGSGMWFDVLVAVVLAWGIVRGRKRGMSEELLSLMQILTVLTVCGMYHRPLGNWFAEMANVTYLFAYLFTYACLLILVVAVFGAVRRAVGEKLVGSDLFGRMEYVLGMVSGMVRYASYMLVMMAILNAPVYTQEEVRAQVKRQVDSLGSNFFPTPGQVQRAMMKESFTGRWVHRNLESLLIQPTASGAGPVVGGPAKPQLKELKQQEINKATAK